MSLEDNKFNQIKIYPQQDYKVPALPNTGEKPTFPKLRTIGGVCSLVALGLVYAFQDSSILRHSLCQTTPRTVLLRDGVTTNTYWHTTDLCMGIYNGVNRYQSEIIPISATLLFISAIALRRYAKNRKIYKEIEELKKEYNKKDTNTEES